MAKEVMDRRASDNKYLHRDFHGGLNYGLNYVGEKYGDEGVQEYLSDFARSYHAPLIQAIRKEGLDAIEAYLREIYAAEEASDELELNRTPDKLQVHIKNCPAVTYLRNKDIEPSRWFVETTRTVWATIAAEAGIQFELMAYHSETGEAEYCFSVTSL